MPRNNKKWRASKSPEELRLFDRKYNLKAKHGLTIEQFDELLLSQDSLCAICRSDAPGVKDRTWHVDHCHSSGAIRGVLCHPCNVMLGHAKDDPTILLAGVSYLEKHASL